MFHPNFMSVLSILLPAKPHPALSLSFRPISMSNISLSSRAVFLRVESGRPILLAADPQP